MPVKAPFWEILVLSSAKGSVKTAPTSLHPGEYSHKLLDVYVKLDAWPSDQHFKAGETFSLKVWSPVAASELVAGESKHLRSLSSLSDIYHLVGLRMWDPLFLKVRCFGGLVSQVHVLKIGVPDVRFKFFDPQGEALGFELHLILGHRSRGRINWVPLLLPSSRWISSVCKMCSSHYF